MAIPPEEPNVVDNIVHSLKLEIKVKDKDVSAFLNEIFISNSINFYHPVINLTFNLDFKKYFVESNFTGKDLLSIKIFQTDSSGEKIVDTYETQLMIVGSNIELLPDMIDAYTIDNSASNKRNPQSVILKTIPVSSLDVLGTQVNYVIEDDNDTPTPFELIQRLIEENVKINGETIPKKKLLLDKRNQNILKLRQLCVPPMTINILIEYMDRHFGIFSSPKFFYVDSNGEIKLWSLKEKFQDSPKYIIHVYAKDYHDNPNSVPNEILKLVDESLKKDAKVIHYLTTEAVSTVKHSNATMVVNGYRQKYITHPSNDLFKATTLDAQEIVDYNKFRKIKSTNPDKPTEEKKLKINEKVKTLKNHKYNFSTDTATSDLLYSHRSKFFANLEPIRVHLGGSLRFSFLMDVGCPAGLQSHMTAYDNFDGRYYVQSSNVILSRDIDNDWQCNAELILERSV